MTPVAECLKGEHKFGGAELKKIGGILQRANLDGWAQNPTALRIRDLSEVEGMIAETSRGFWDFPQERIRGVVCPTIFENSWPTVLERGLGRSSKGTKDRKVL